MAVKGGCGAVQCRLKRTQIPTTLPPPGLSQRATSYACTRTRVWRSETDGISTDAFSTRLPLTYTFECDDIIGSAHQQKARGG